MTTILAVDLGTNTGWALLRDGCVESGTAVFDVRRGESCGMRYVKFNSWLADFAYMRPFIVYEAPHHRGGAATEIAAGFATRIHEFCARNGFEHQSVHSASLKKFATGRGNAKKPEMIAAAQRLKPGVSDDNEADAIWLLEWARKNMNGSGK